MNEMKGAVGAGIGRAGAAARPQPVRPAPPGKEIRKRAARRPLAPQEKHEYRKGE